MSAELSLRSKNRNSNIEFLRIISMLLIIGYHATRSAYIGEGTAPLVVRVTEVLFGSWGILGVDLFLIISAWFLVDQQFTIKRILNIALQVTMYVFAFLLVYVIWDFWHMKSISIVVQNFVMHSLKGLFQPFWGDYYWFITAYVFMIVVSPISNKLLRECSEHQLKKLLLIFLFIPIYAQNSLNMVCDAVYFMYVYLLIGYFKKYKMNYISRLACGKIAILIAVLVTCSRLSVIMDILSPFQGLVSFILLKTMAAVGRHSVVLLILGIFIFFAVQKRPEKNNKIVNYIASCTLGVYLFHENNIFDLPNTLNVILSRLNRLGVMNADGLFPLKYVGVVFCVFSVGILIESVRMKFFHKPLINGIETRFSNQIKKVDEWFCRF